jgi:hypothetical protein
VALSFRTCRLTLLEAILLQTSTCARDAMWAATSSVAGGSASTLLQDTCARPWRPIAERGKGLRQTRS